MMVIKFLVVMTLVMGSLGVGVNAQSEGASEDVDKIEIKEPQTEMAVETVTILEEDPADEAELLTSDKDEAETSELMMEQNDQTEAKSTEVVEDLVKEIETEPETEPTIEIIAEPDTSIEVVKKAAALVERPLDSTTTEGEDTEVPIGEINTSDDEEPKQLQSKLDVVELTQMSEKQEQDVNYDDSDDKVEEKKNVEETTTIQSTEEPVVPIQVQIEPKVDANSVDEIEHPVPDTNNTDENVPHNANASNSSVDTDKNPHNNETPIDDRIENPKEEEGEKTTSLDAEQPTQPQEQLNTNPDHQINEKVKQPVSANEQKPNSNTRPAGVNVLFIIIPVVCGAAVLLIVIAMILAKKTNLFRSSDDDYHTPSTTKKPIYKEVSRQEPEPTSPEAQNLV